MLYDVVAVELRTHKILWIEPDKTDFRPLGRDSLCPAGASFVSTMPAPLGFCEEAGCGKV